LDAVRQKEPAKAVESILGHLLSTIGKLGKFSDDAKIAVDAAIESSIGAVVAIIEEKNLHIEALKAELGGVYNQLETEKEIVAQLAAGRTLGEVLDDLGHRTVKGGTDTPNKRGKRVPMSGNKKN
jgi:hypothetical protein